MSATRDAEQALIDREASGWLIRIEEDSMDAAAGRDFDNWLARDPRHRATYDAMRETWSDLADIPELGALAPLPPEPTGEERVVPLRPRRPAWHWAAGGALAASIAGAALLLSPWSSADPHYRTELAETRVVTLPDGTKVTLGGRSSIAVAFRAGERRVTLLSGEALFDVAQETRPFVVEAGSSLIRDIGTKFDVNRTQSSVRVGVLEGLVEVSRTDGGRIAPVRIGRGEGVRMAEPRPGAALGAAPPAASPIRLSYGQTPGAWREGRLVFDDVRLTDLTADVNRYYAPGVTLGSAEVGELRVTAAFKISEIPAFMGALDATLPVRAERLPDGRFRIVDARR